MIEALHNGDAETRESGAVSAEWTKLSRSELVRRVVQSSSFARSERLSSFLVYVCDMALKGRQAELNEQRIGHAVFGRARDYDSSIDGIVRTQASRLRQRLDQYFDGDGTNEPIRIEIPKGGYVPVFVERQQRPEPVTEPAPDEVPSAAAVQPAFKQLETETPHVRKRAWLPWTLCVALLVCCAALLVRRSTTSAPMPHLLWSQVFTPGRATLEVPGDSGLVLSYLFTQKGVGLSGYMAGKYHEPGQAGASPMAQVDDATRRDITSRRYTSIVDLAVSAQLERIAISQGSSLQIRYARDMRPNDLKEGNAILMGASEGNPWVELFEPRLNFRFSNSYRTHIFTVLNHEPKPGEPAKWESVTGDAQRVYGVVALLPNLAMNGNVLIVEGTSMAGVEAAWDFLTDDKELLPLLHRMQRPDGSLPSFEFLVGTQNMGASAAHGELIAWRTYDESLISSK